MHLSQIMNVSSLAMRPIRLLSLPFGGLRQCLMIYPKIPERPIKLHLVNMKTK